MEEKKEKKQKNTKKDVKPTKPTILARRKPIIIKSGGGSHLTGKSESAAKGVLGGATTMEIEIPAEYQHTAPSATAGHTFKDAAGSTEPTSEISQVEIVMVADGVKTVTTYECNIFECHIRTIHK